MRILGGHGSSGNIEVSSVVGGFLIAFGIDILLDNALGMLATSVGLASGVLLVLVGLIISGMSMSLTGRDKTLVSAGGGFLIGIGFNLFVRDAGQLLLDSFGLIVAVVLIVIGLIVSSFSFRTS